VQCKDTHDQALDVCPQKIPKVVTHCLYTPPLQPTFCNVSITNQARKCMKYHFDCHVFKKNIWLSTDLICLFIFVKVKRLSFSLQVAIDDYKGQVFL
jgi:hypothetical protein